METVFEDRVDAGRRLAARLAVFGGADTLVLGLPRGGVPVAYQVARALGAELDVLVVRKIGVPGQPEFAMGAIASGGVEVLDHKLIRALGVDRAQVDAVVETERAELARRERAYRGDRPPPRVAGRTVLVVDDGLATGASMRAALSAVRSLGPARLVVAVPVAPRGIEDQFRDLADEVVCVSRPADFRAVGAHYRHFGQTGDAEVQSLLAAARDGEAS